MNKLKEEFDLINRLIDEYREENGKLKEGNRLMSMQLGQRTNNLMAAHSNFSSPQHSTIKTYSHVEGFQKASFTANVMGGWKTTSDASMGPEK